MTSPWKKTIVKKSAGPRYVEDKKKREKHKDKTNRQASSFFDKMQ